MRWPTLVYNGWPLPATAAGCAIGPIILIREGYENDEGLYRHELQHVKQFFTTLCTMPFLYLLYRPFKLWAEVQAYKVQMHYPDRNGNFLSLDGAAYRLALPLYNLNLTLNEARIALL